MTPEQALIWNAAIDAAVDRYKSGIGAIMALRVSMPIVIDHKHTNSEVFGEVSGNNN